MLMLMLMPIPMMMVITAQEQHELREEKRREEEYSIEDCNNSISLQFPSSNATYSLFLQERFSALINAFTLLFNPRNEKNPHPSPSLSFPFRFPFLPSIRSHNFEDS